LTRVAERGKLKNLHSVKIVARERLQKTEQAGKCLAGAEVNGKVGRLSTALYCSSECYVQVVSKSNILAIPHL
jgi:hypothetical protein